MAYKPSPVLAATEGNAHDAELFPRGRSQIRLSQVKQGAVAQTALVKLALASLLNDVLRK
jgi:hypothetical protein